MSFKNIAEYEIIKTISFYQDVFFLEARKDGIKYMIKQLDSKILENFKFI